MKPTKHDTIIELAQKEYDKIKAELDHLKGRAFEVRLVSSGRNVRVESHHEAYGWEEIGLWLDPDLPVDIGEELSMEGMAIVSVIVTRSEL